jgi:UDP-N-acetylmuramate dehydrogenase
LVLGNGSNVLASDEGFGGVVLRPTAGLATVEVGVSRIRAGAGAALGSVVKEAARASLSGLEFAVGIPGTVGGAVMTNAGAFSGNIAGVIELARAITGDGEQHEYESFTNGYRESLVPVKEILTSATFRLAEAPFASIKKRVDEVWAMRRETQPHGRACAGSVFKNPSGDSAGRLIEACGLKGESVGGARVSELHANFIINEGAASAADIKTLIEKVAKAVNEGFGITLETEVELIGFEEE